MTTSIWHVVGDRFGEFACNPQVVTITPLLRALRGEAPFAYGEEARFVAGLGLQRELSEALLTAAERAGRQAHFAHWRMPRPADGRLSHKHQEHNTLVTTPVRLEEDLFEAELVLDERSELLADHLTGQHLSGMLLAEAGRQMFMAVIEEHLSSDRQRRSSIVLTVMNNAYLGYAFPIALRLRTRLLERKQEGEKLQLYTLTEALQGRTSVMQQEVRGLVLDHSIVATLEAVQAKRSLANVGASHGGGA